MKKAKPLPDIDFLREIFAISDRPSGLVRKRGSPSCGAGSVNGRGYWYTRIAGALYSNHRVIYALANDGSQPDVVDHIDGNSLNNSPSNLRAANRYTNMQNRAFHANNTTGITGVFYKKRTGRWFAQVSVNGVPRHLGYFDSKERAAEFRELAALIVYGEYQRSSPLAKIS